MKYEIKNIDKKEMLEIYNSISQKDHEKYESIFELYSEWYEIPRDDLLKTMSYYVFCKYLLENKII